MPDLEGKTGQYIVDVVQWQDGVAVINVLSPEKARNYMECAE